MKPRRNDPCHCGSDRKYKKCCLERDLERARGDRPTLTIDGSKAPKVEDGHIVPRMYQRAWENARREVAVHVDGASEVKSSKLVATRGPYYRRTRPEGEQTDDIEQSLSVIETKAAAPLRALVAGQGLEPERKGIVAQLLAVQMLRGPAFFDQREQILRPALEGMTVDDLTPRGRAAVGGDADLARTKVTAAYLDPTERFVTMLTYAVKVASVLGLMRWQILRFDGPLLAYSDHPVVLWPLKVPSSRPFGRQGIGALETLEIRVPIAPDAAILMNWLDLSDEVGVEVPPSIAAELNAFTISQAEIEFMHAPGYEPKLATGVFRPLSRLFDGSYSPHTVVSSLRHRTAAEFLASVQGRRFVDGVKVLVDIGRDEGRPIAA